MTITRKQELVNLIKYQERFIQLSLQRASWWTAMATTGVATTRDTHRGREVTEEERANGQVIGWRPESDDEKVKNALDTAHRHIEIAQEFSDALADCERELSEIERQEEHQAYEDLRMRGPG